MVRFVLSPNEKKVMRTVEELKPSWRNEMEITGRSSAVAFASSSARDTDFVVTLASVFPDRYAQMNQEAFLERHLQRGPLIP